MSIGTESESAIDARLLHMLRREMDPRTASSGVGAEILRLAGLAAAVHRGAVIPGGGGAAVACNQEDSIAIVGGDAQETPR